MKIADISTPSASVTSKLALSPAEAAHATGLGRSTIYKLIKAGRLSRVKIGSRTLLSVADLEVLIHSSKAPNVARSSAASEFQVSRLLGDQS